MPTENPYQSPQIEANAPPVKRYENPHDFWIGLFLSVAGAAAFLLQVVLLFAPGVISTWLVGGGIGMLAVGALRLRAYFADRTYSRQVSE